MKAPAGETILENKGSSKRRTIQLYKSVLKVSFEIYYRQA